MKKRVSVLWCVLASLMGVCEMASASSSVTLKWTAPGDDSLTGQASVYDVRYSLLPITDANWASATSATGVPAPKVAGSAESFDVTGLVANTVYYFAVKTGDEVPNWSLLSNVVSRTTAANAPAPPVPLGPANGGTLVATAPTLIWNASSGATSYHVQLSNSSTFGTTIVDQSGLTATSLAVSGLTLSTTYYWRVNATNSSGTSAYSATWSFTTVPPSTGGSVVSFRTLGNSTASRLVTAKYTYMSYALCDSTGYLDSLVVPMHNNWDGNDTLYGIVYSGTASDIGALVARSKDSVIVNSSTLTSYVFHFNAGTVALSASTVYYIGVHSMGSSGYTKVGASSNTTGRTGYALDAAPPDSPWGLTEYTNQNQIDMIAYYHTGAAATGPSAPTLSSPVNGATLVAAAPTLIWNASSGATSYHVQLSNSSTFGTTIVNQSGLSATSVGVSGLTLSTTYYWRVNATNSSGTSAYSATWSFTTVPPSTGGSVASFRTLGNSTDSRLVTAKYTYMSYALCDSTGYLDSLIVPLHDNWDGNDTLYGIVYSGTASDIGALVARSKDSVIVNSSTLTSYVFHFNAGTVALSPAKVYYIGVHSMSSSGYTKVGATSNTTGRTGYGLDAAPPDSPWGLTEYTNQNQIDMIAYYHTGAAVIALDPPEQNDLAKKAALPSEFSLSQNYPNPFNPTTRIEFSLPKPGRVLLEVFNVIGQRVRTLIDGDLAAGNHTVEWNSTGDVGNRVASGIYFYRLQTGDQIATKKMILLK